VRRAVERATCEEGSEKTSRSSRVVIVTSRDIDDLDLTERRVDLVYRSMKTPMKPRAMR